MTFDLVSFSVGVGCGFLFYLFCALMIALWVSKKWKNEVQANDDIYLKRLRECGYTEDIFE